MTIEKKATIIINNRDLLDWPRNMVQQLEKMASIHEIIILDNASTYKPLLNWYKSIPHRVIFQENLGHKAPWTSDILDQIKTDYYIVSDPDLDISKIPHDTVSHLINLIDKFPDYEKIGLSLETDGIPKDSPYYEHVLRTERSLQDNINKDSNGLLLMPVDTTFAIYNKNILNQYKICGARTPSPYTAKHEPWYIIKPSNDFAYYLDNAEGTSSSYKIFSNYTSSTSLQGMYNAHNSIPGSKVSTKWETYLSVYEEILSPFKNKSINILEIGIQNGGSLEIWSKYFKNANRIVGCDINPRCKQLTFDDPRITVKVGNSNDNETFQSIVSITNSYDIIIDDGSHTANDTILNFINYFPLLSEGGYFIIEDMHCAYWEEYGGGILNERSSAAFFRKLFDSVNMDHFREIDAGSLFQSFFNRQYMNKFLENNHILSVTSYDSMFIIRKASTLRPRGLGTEIIVGDTAIADDRVLKIKKIAQL